MRKMVGWTTVNRIESDTLNGACLEKRCSCGHEMTVRAVGNDAVGSAMCKAHEEECLHQQLVRWCRGNENKLAALDELVESIPTSVAYGYKEEGEVEKVFDDQGNLVYEDYSDVEEVDVPWISRRGTKIVMASPEDVDVIYDGLPLSKEIFGRIREIFLADEDFLRVERIHAQELRDLLTESEQAEFSPADLSRRVEVIDSYERRIVNLPRKAIKRLEKIQRLNVQTLERGGCIVSSR